MPSAACLPKRVSFGGARSLRAVRGADCQPDQRDGPRKVQQLDPVRRHLAPEAARGYARLPEPSAGDVFFDLEGDPYATADGGIEYLCGGSR